MIVWQVTPLSRPEQLGRVVREFAAQTHADRRLCIVANGDAIDVAVPNGVDLVLRTEPGKPSALNAALGALQGELVAIRDDDDTSLPGDLEECVTALGRTGAEIVSRLRHRVLLDGERWVFAERHANQWGNASVWGGSLMFRVTDDTPPFPNELVTESQSWARRMVAMGARVWRPSTENQIHVRASFAGMWKAGPLEIRRTLGMQEAARKQCADGSWRWFESPTLIATAAERARCPLLSASGHGIPLRRPSEKPHRQSAPLRACAPPRA